jgi:hypothetical protein
VEEKDIKDCWYVEICCKREQSIHGHQGKAQNNDPPCEGTPLISEPNKFAGYMHIMSGGASAASLMRFQNVWGRVRRRKKNPYVKKQRIS